MYKIVRKEKLNPTVTKMDIYAPFVAKKAKPGQFIILRVDEDGERIPLTVADYDRDVKDGAWIRSRREGFGCASPARTTASTRCAS